MVAVTIPANRAPKAVQASPKQEGTPSTDKRKKKFFRQRSPGVVHNTAINTYARPILNEALSSAAAQSVQKFSTWASRSAKMFDVAKLAEGSYGEVYKLHLRDEACRPAASKSKLAKLRAYGDGVFKVVPLRAQSGPGSKKFTTIEEIVSETKMLKYLDPIPGFARFREIHVVQGRFPDAFQDAWDHYKKTSDDCLNPNPSSKKAYPDSQLWAIVEMDDAGCEPGCELEKFCWSSVFQIYDIFWGVAMALARAEEYALFEVGIHTAILAHKKRRLSNSFSASRSSLGKCLHSIYLFRWLHESPIGPRHHPSGIGQRVWLQLPRNDHYRLLAFTRRLAASRQRGECHRGYFVGFGQKADFRFHWPGRRRNSSEEHLPIVCLFTIVPYKHHTNMVK
jgi:hypothetical protein